MSSLLAYLMLRRGSNRPRERIAFALWPDSNGAQARTNLRHLLHTVLRIFPDFERIFDVTPRTITLNSNVDVWCDVYELGRDWSMTGKLSTADLDQIRLVVKLYTGDLLEDCYDEWIVPERERLRATVVQLIEREDLVEATEAAERLLRLEALNEP